MSWINDPVNSLKMTLTGHPGMDTASTSPPTPIFPSLGERDTNTSGAVRQR